MKLNSIVDSITDYICNHPEVKTKQPYEIYNCWATTSGVIIKDAGNVQWLTSYISDLKTISQDVLKNAIFSKK